jgi:hypothetical protein
LREHYLYKNFPKVSDDVSEQDFLELQNGSNLIIDSTFQNTFWLKYLNPTKSTKQLKVSLRNDLGFDKHNSEAIVGIHFRFGDFLNPNIMREYGYLSDNYYLGSIREISQRMNIGRLIVFSEDKKLASDRIKKLSLHLYLDNAEEKVIHSQDLELSEVDEMLMMSQCDALIVSNSSFSWWGAYLCDETTTVVAPMPIYRKFFKEQIVKEGWFRINGYDNE